MNFYSYIGKTPTEFLTEYINTGLVDIASHDTFPLVLYTYGRKTVHENIWDEVTSKCRGIIVHRETGEVIARPFEKFHNYGSVFLTGEDEVASMGEPVIWEKMDGFICTQYVWEGRNYIASKGSFHSPHAKWATKEFNRAIMKAGYTEDGGSLREGYTLMFEGLNRDLRIVVDYGQRQELVLLAVINIETGEELRPERLREFAKSTGFSTPLQNNLTLAEARHMTMAEASVFRPVDEGYVLTWYQDGKPPFRLKLKFIEYLRLHRMVTGVSPKRIWEVLAGNQSSELNEYLRQSTPWFSAFVQKWLHALTWKYQEIETEATARYSAARETCRVKVGQRPYENMGAERKEYALEFTREENKPYSAVLFALLDGKDIKPVIWKMVKTLTHGHNPMVDAHNT